MDEGRQHWSGPSPMVKENVVRWRFLDEPHGGINFIQCVDSDGRVSTDSIHITTADHKSWREEPKTEHGPRNQGRSDIQIPLFLQPQKEQISKGCIAMMLAWFRRGH